jgi:hypothetical protein
LTTVVAGKVIPIARNIALYASDRAVPLSLIRISKELPFAGDPVGAAIVAPAASAVTYNSFCRDPPVGVGVALEAVVVTSANVFVVEINVLFVRVSVLEAVIYEPTA